jgi:hypothetical protein
MTQVLKPEQTNRLDYWPLPLHYKLKFDPKKPQVEQCILIIEGEKKYLGDLISFIIQERKLLFQPRDTNEKFVVPFSKIRSLQLSWPSKLVPELTLFDPSSATSTTNLEKQSFRIEYCDGVIHVRDTLGYLDNEEGVFIYPVLNDDYIERLFVPRHAIKNFQIVNKINKSPNENLIKQTWPEGTTRIQATNINIGPFIHAKDLYKEFAELESQSVMRLGEIFIGLNLITSDQLEMALLRQKENRKKRLGEILLEMGLIVESQLKITLARKFGIPYVNLTSFIFEPEAIKMVPANLIRKFLTMPLCLQGRKLVLALEDPMNVQTIREIEFLTQCKVLPVMGLHEEIVDAINKYYETGLIVQYHVPLNTDGSIEFRV